MSNNKSRAVALVSIIALWASIGPAYAQPAYKASDIVAHFAPAKKANLGASRAICIGTESECPKEISAQPKVVSNFDLRINFDYNSANLTRRPAPISMSCARPAGPGADRIAVRRRGPYRRGRQ